MEVERPVTPTFRFADRPRRVTHNSKNGLLPQNIPPLQTRRAPHVDEMLTLSESGIEPSQAVLLLHNSRPGFKPVPGDALLVIDVQNDDPGRGALEVAGGHEVVPVCNALMDRFDVVVFSQDWHCCKGHLSFASSHDKSPYDSTQMPYGDRTSPVARPWSGIRGGRSTRPVHPGPRPRRAQGFQEGYRLVQRILRERSDHPDGARGYLKDIGHQEGVCVRARETGLCVRFTAVDVKVKCGFDEPVAWDATRSVGLPGTVERADEGMKEAGVKVADSGSLVAAFPRALPRNLTRRSFHGLPATLAVRLRAQTQAPTSARMGGTAGQRRAERPNARTPRRPRRRHPRKSKLRRTPTGPRLLPRRNRRRRRWKVQMLPRTRPPPSARRRSDWPSSRRKRWLTCGNPRTRHPRR